MDIHKEKAIELINKAYKVCPYHSKVIGVALLIVDEIIKEFFVNEEIREMRGCDITIVEFDLKYEYWQEVKQEIINSK